MFFEGGLLLVQTAHEVAGEDELAGVFCGGLLQVIEAIVTVFVPGLVAVSKVRRGPLPVLGVGISYGVLGYEVRAGFGAAHPVGLDLLGLAPLGIVAVAIDHHVGPDAHVVDPLIQEILHLLLGGLVALDTKGLFVFGEGLVGGKLDLISGDSVA